MSFKDSVSFEKKDKILSTVYVDYLSTIQRNKKTHILEINSPR